MEKLNERRDKIIAFLKTSNFLSIKELAELLKVSTMTIRRDLEILAAQNIIQFYHGGAVFNSHYLEEVTNPHDYYIQQQTMLHKDEKTIIARIAAELLIPQETIMLD